MVYLNNVGYTCYVYNKYIMLKIKTIIIKHECGAVVFLIFRPGYYCRYLPYDVSTVALGG